MEITNEIANAIDAELKSGIATATQAQGEMSKQASIAMSYATSVVKDIHGASVEGALTSMAEIWKLAVDKRRTVISHSVLETAKAAGVAVSSTAQVKMSDQSVLEYTEKLNLKSLAQEAIDLFDQGLKSMERARVAAKHSN